MLGTPQTRFSESAERVQLNLDAGALQDFSNVLCDRGSILAKNLNFSPAIPW